MQGVLIITLKAACDGIFGAYTRQEMHPPFSDVHWQAVKNHPIIYKYSSFLFTTFFPTRISTGSENARSEMHCLQEPGRQEMHMRGALLLQKMPEQGLGDAQENL